ncbi:deoxynucleotide monophosphate kinase family protein [Peribacillus butanolivorans]|uniref:Adenylate kinase n=1 Tax=Peribacillus butanolivorans TaxID=421767 RepID=A0ABN5N5H8_9BACI|nr:adenylate kinase [Peribacillus butanolivorans]AXN39832.1 adenylate kinase [Peribacillus butanolivorans]
MTDVPKIIIVGRLRSGKTVVADYIRYQHGFTEIAFGSMLKYFAAQVFAHSEVTKGVGKNRQLLQSFGQSCRSVDENVWLQHAEFSYNLAMDSRATKGIVISDGRQPNEIAWAKSQGFAVVRITAPEDVRLARAVAEGDDFKPADLTHETESFVDTFGTDYEIVNDGTLDDLYAQVDEVIAKIKEAE